MHNVHIVCPRQSNLNVAQNVIGCHILMASGHWQSLCSKLNEYRCYMCFGLANLFNWQERPSFWLESGGLCYTCCLCWQGPDYFINQLLVWSLTLFVRRIHVEDFILSLPLLSFILVSPCHFFSLLSRYASISSKNHSNIHKCWQTHFK